MAPGRFGTPTSYGFGSLSEVRVADVTQDGNLDLVKTKDRSGPVGLEVFPGAGDGSFGPVAFSPTGDDPLFFELRDLDRDGSMDDLLSRRAPSPNPNVLELHFLRGQGDGSFLFHRTLSVGAGPGAVRIANVQGSDALDAVVSLGDGDALEVLEGDGTGDFGVPFQVSVDSAPTRVSFGDMDLDGQLDVVFGHGSSTLGILFGRAGAPLGGPRYFHAGGNSFSTLADIDENGTLDIVSAVGGGRISVLRNLLRVDRRNRPRAMGSVSATPTPGAPSRPAFR